MSFLNDIVKQMYVDPELLEMLSPEHKEILFRKIREEQLKQWAKKDKELEKKKKHFAKKRTPRKINFKLGTDGEPWVWVMGEHPNDLPYEELVRHREQEEQEKERLNELQDMKEAEELAKQEARGLLSLAKIIEEEQNGTDETDGPEPESVSTSLKGKHSVSDEPHLKLSLARTESSQLQASPHLGVRFTESDLKKEEEEKRRTISRRASQIGSTQEQLIDFEKKRAEELFDTLMRAKRIAKKRAAEMSKNVEARWEESEKKVKEYERTRRSSFKKAREIIENDPEASIKIIEEIAARKSKRKLALRKPVRPVAAPPNSRPLLRFSSFVRPGTSPKTPAHVERWFRDSEAPKGVGREMDGSISVWFHGKISRGAAEKLLESKPNGSYLVRLSTKIWGFTVSVNSYCGCKHYLIDASLGEYHFLGPKQQKFDSLSSLLRFYRVNPITWAGQEVLLLPVGSEEEDTAAFEGLYCDDDELGELGESGTYL